MTATTRWLRAGVQRYHRLFSTTVHDSTIENELQSTVRQFVRDEVVPKAAEFDLSGEYPWEIVRKLHGLGLMNTDTPEELGGLSLNLRQKVKIYEEIAYGDTAIGTSLMVSELAQIPLLQAGSDFLKQKYVSRMTKEPILAAYCTTEADAGSDVANAKMKAVQDGDSYVLDGSKVWISNCGLASWYFILAKTDPNASASKAFTGFVVDRDAKGVSVGKKEKNMGQRCSDTRTLTLENVRVPKENVVGKVGEGFLLAMRAFDRTRPIVASMGCGVQQRALDEAMGYALQRKTFGKKIIDHQVIAFKLADMAQRLEASRLLVEKAARKVDEKDPEAPYYSSIAKCTSADAAFLSASEAVQIFGGNGFNTEYPVEKLLRDSKILQIYGGTNEWKKAIPVAVTSVVGGSILLYKFDERSLLINAAQPIELKPPSRPDLPCYKVEEIKKHGKDASRIWGVYDVTEFLESHPGGDKLLLAAGGSVEPFWAIYAQHKTNEVMEILEGLRIGNVDPEDLRTINSRQKDANDPFSTDPIRHPALIVNSAKPFNAEIPPSLLMDNFLTPNELFFVRNHMPVPETDDKLHVVVIEGEGIRRPIKLTVEDIKKNFQPYSVSSVVQCAGNRRNDMNEYKKVNGLMWTGTAISNAKWTGARLRPNDENVKHVHFEGADHDITGTHYGASITIEKAMSPEVLVAYQMNDEDIPPDHGFPLRLVAPGLVGARQVKWLSCIRTDKEESPSHWQRKDYRAFSPSVESGSEIDYNSVPAIQEYPVQSAICIPAPGTKISKDDGTFTVSGYAWSGGGRGIIRVEVSTDGGKSWQSAKLTQDSKQDIEHMWAWTFWTAEISIPDAAKVGDKLEIVCKATDRAYNTQPETAAGLWNIRGLLHTAWHRINVLIIE